METVYHSSYANFLRYRRYMMGDNLINFQITESQAQKIANHFGKDLYENKLEDYEICEFLDKLIDEEL